MKCIYCNKEAEYIYITSIPLTGVMSMSVGGSMCSECKKIISESCKESLERWEKKREEFALKISS